MRIHLALLAPLLLGGCAAWQVPTSGGTLPPALRGNAGVTCVLYLDLNGNGWHDQGEPPVPELPVVLDGKARTMTDACGRFRFDGLAPGFHRLSVEPGEVPSVYEGMDRVDQNVRAGTETANAVFEVGMARPRPVATARAAPPTLPVVHQVSATALEAASEVEKQRALVAIEQAAGRLARLRTSGYQVLVQDTLARVEGALTEARGLVAAGDAAGAQRLAGLSATALDESRKRIETETQQPLRW